MIIPHATATDRTQAHAYTEKEIADSQKKVENTVFFLDIEHCAVHVHSSVVHCLIFITLWANSAGDKLIFFLFSPENKHWHFMRTVFSWDN